MDLGYVFRRTRQITWQHRRLWVLGFLVSLGTVGARLGMNPSYWERPGQWLPPEVRQALVDLSSSPYFTLLVIALVLLALVIGVGLTLLNALGRAALVDQVRAAEDRGAVSLRDGWQVAKRHFWPVFIIRLLLGLPIAVAVLAGSLPLVATALLISGQTRPEVVIPGVLGMEFALFACLAPAICLSVLLSIPLGVLQRLAVRACVLEGLGTRESIARAWGMLREHPGPLALVWIILLAVGIGAIAVVGLPLLLLLASLLTVVLLTMLISPLLYVALILVIELLAWLAASAIGGAVETFISAAWTLTFRDLAGMGLTGEDPLQSI